ncbi:hypothetical protein BJV77DRAFT_1039081, partial [Russula vinacea]
FFPTLACEPDRRGLHAYSMCDVSRQTICPSTMLVTQRSDGCGGLAGARKAPGIERQGGIAPGMYVRTVSSASRKIQPIKPSTHVR